MPDKAHGTEPRGLFNTPRQRSYDGRFGRLFQDLAKNPAHNPESESDVRELATVAAAMREAAGEGRDNPTIPSGYVYLGQFIDHDVTFDPVSQLQRRNDPDGLINFRTPRFDLDSVYGSGPLDEPFQYEPGGPHDGFAFLLDPSGLDLPRNSRNRALIGDPRNDENGIVSQLQVAFLRLHNRVMKDLLTASPDVTPADRFAVAQRSVQWHYQWVVAHDFLRRTVGAGLHDALLLHTPDPDADGGSRESVRLRYYRHKTNPYLPVEFSAAAYRFGHSQVRDEYSINGSFRRRLFDAGGDDFRGFQPLRPGWQASWPFFFEIDGTAPQLSRGIDASLALTLTTLQGASGADADLPLRNLLRGAALGLPTGQDMARRMGVEPLPQNRLAPAAEGRAPLWFYVLREAQELTGGEHLGPVGGRIVGETLLGLLRADPQSYLTLEPSWLPTLPARNGPAAFDMVDLLTHAVPDQAKRF